ncbi:MAG: 6,7-dimethyl-8-ribityllumazine synthase [Bacteroidales bacterium]|jgi:6,7-dimethyl-8-ribityllumazine synthase|nr:6,7-dimethyl-8-ribityllumazine synthase [Bacteroidales bacterium]MDD2593472.1 6,7-dimethyl-8-ribityllumazine synthase [Bacteroidales bacterium]MDD3755705.1 6,7-dimethyl-8-ribityllumazine synthase [Bacteroidales bacterium]MDY0400706.1 6,7-dimethyl-8-ribityllumazine synthase [Bacteroidales bacterium]HHW59857.1 6,7-dimethyl-8-ribityllumazine synthase [Bacteroidales bacterium]
MNKKINLSKSEANDTLVGSMFRYAIIVSDWNKEITDRLLKGAYETLLEHGAKAEHIAIKHVPGSYELPQLAQIIAKKQLYDVIICLGSVIQGETRHFEFISDAVANGCMNVALQHSIPVVFGVLTTNDYQQAIERSGGSHGNKGVEAAITAIKMARTKENL